MTRILTWLGHLICLVHGHHHWRITPDTQVYCVRCNTTPEGITTLHEEEPSP